jgi:hypothetical protein
MNYESQLEIANLELQAITYHNTAGCREQKFCGDKE